MKLVITIFILFSYIPLSFSQADLMIDFFMYDNAVPPYNGSWNLTFGLDSTATDGIDPHLGEFPVPPDVCCGLGGPILCAVFSIPNNMNSTWIDYRFGEIPYTGIKEHKIWYCSHPSSTEVTIQCNLPSGVSAILQDRLIGTLIYIEMSDSGEYHIPDNLIGLPLKFTVYYNTPLPDTTVIFSIEPESLFFGGVPIGVYRTLPVVVSNVGVVNPLIIYDILSSNSAFSVSPTNFPISIPAQTTKTFYVTLYSTQDSLNGILKFIHNAPDSPFLLPVSSELIIADVHCDILIKSSTKMRMLSFGLDSLATDSIDVYLGEYRGPMPPWDPGFFNAIFFLPQNNFGGIITSYKDYRFAVFPFSGRKEYRLAYQQEGTNDVDISWYLPDGVTGVLQDIITGTLINIEISDTGSFTVPDPLVFDRLKLLIDFEIPVPVELTSFTASLSGSSVVLNWTTATETNNAGYEIQRKNPPLNPLQGGENFGWEKIGYVSGFGTTTEPKSYSCTDGDVSTGIYKYRLKQIDYNGTFDYSNEVEIEVNLLPKEFILYQNYPNPFNPKTKIKFLIPQTMSPLTGGAKGGFVTLKVYDILGKEVAVLVNEEKEPGVYEIEFDASEFSSGIYIYQLKSESFILSKKMSIIK